MTTEYLTEDRKPHAAGRAARLSGLFAGLTALLLAACSSSSNDGGPPPPPPPPPPPTNTAPTASAGPDMIVSTTIVVQLDASASSDADGDALTFAWSIASAPGGSSAAFDDDTSAQPSFTPDVAGDYTIELVVSDGTTTSTADELVVTASDNTVIQSIGPGGGQVVSADGIVTLDIPAGALMAAEDIAITLIPTDQRDSYLGPEFDVIPDIDAVYDFAPSGLTFVVPATVTFATADNPVIDANTMGGPAPFLFTSDGSNLEVLNELTLTADADSAASTISGQLDHFSPGLLSSFRTSGSGTKVSWRIGNIPSLIETFATVDVRPEMVTAVPLLDVNYADLAAESPFNPVQGVPLSLPLEQIDLSRFARDITYECDGPGTTTYSIFLTFILGTGETNADLGLAGISYGIIPKKIVTCQDSPGADSRLLTRLLGIPASLTQPESVQAALLLNGFPRGGNASKTWPAEQSAAGSAAVGTDDPVGLFAGAEGNVLVNLLTGEVIRDATDPTRTDPVFGAVLASSALPNGTPAGMIYQFGSGTFGGLRCDYDPVIQDFGFFCLTQTGRAYDAVPLGNTHETTQVSFATNFGVGVWRLDPTFGTYERSPEFDTDTNSFFGTPFSAVRGDPAGPLLVITNRAPDYTTLDLVDPDGTVTLVDTFFGEDGRKLRCVGGLCAISVFNDGTGGALRLVIWDGLNAPSVVDTTVAVGDGPVGIDLIALGNGNILIVSTGFNDNTITLTEVTPAGVVVSNNTDPVPTGCLSPGHATWYIPDGVPEESQIVGTCYDSNQYFVLDITLDPADGFRIVPLQL